MKYGDGDSCKPYSNPDIKEALIICSLLSSY